MGPAGLTKRVRPVCDQCGSDDIRIEAYIEWNAMKQDWKLKEVTDNIVCCSCGHDCKPRWVLVT